MKVFITKYALTQGILEREVTQSQEHPSMVSTQGECTSESWVVSEVFHTEGKDWHRTFESAQRRAEKMRKAKIASLNKSLARIENLSFTSTT